MYDASANVDDTIYFRNGFPKGVKSTLSWDSVLSGHKCHIHNYPKYLRKYVDDMISAILSMWSVYNDLPWLTETIENAWVSIYSFIIPKFSSMDPLRT